MADQGSPIQAGAEDPVVSDGKLWAALGYVGLLCILPLALKKDNKFALHHGKQGLVILLMGIACSILMMIPILGWIAAPIIGIALLILAIIGFVQALMGNYWRAPIIADLADKIKI